MSKICSKDGSPDPYTKRTTESVMEENLVIGPAKLVVGKKEEQPEVKRVELDFEPKWLPNSFVKMQNDTPKYKAVDIPRPEIDIECDQFIHDIQLEQQ